MNPESSPFRPGQPAPIEFFIGRRAEIERVRGMVRASTQGRVSIGFVSGERGIGKSSLARFVRHLVEQNDDAVGCHVFLGGVQDLGQMLRRTFERLLNESTDKPWHQKLRDFFGDRVRKVGLFGLTLELNLQERDLAAIKHGFVSSVRRLLDNLAEHKRSLFLILDDINGLAGSDEFANWLKSTVDEIATSDAQARLCILVVGLEARRQELVGRQPSLARVLDPIDIAPWSDDEVLDFYHGAFREGNAEISAASVRTLTLYTGGLPVLAHELGEYQLERKRFAVDYYLDRGSSLRGWLRRSGLSVLISLAAACRWLRFWSSSRRALVPPIGSSSARQPRSRRPCSTLFRPGRVVTSGATPMRAADAQRSRTYWPRAWRERSSWAPLCGPAIPGVPADSAAPRPAGQGDRSEHGTCCLDLSVLRAPRPWHRARLGRGPRPAAH